MSEHVVVVGGGMVAHRFVEALRARDSRVGLPVTVLAEEARAPYDRVGLTRSSPARPRRPRPRRAASSGTTRWCRLRTAARGRGGRPRRAHGRDRRRRVGRLRPPGAGHRVLRVGAAGARRRPARVCSSTARSTTSSPCATGSAREAELGRPVRGAVVGGGLLGLEAAGALVGLGARAPSWSSRRG